MLFFCEAPLPETLGSQYHSGWLIKRQLHVSWKLKMGVMGIATQILSLDWQVCPAEKHRRKSKVCLVHIQPCGPTCKTLIRAVYSSCDEPQCCSSCFTFWHCQEFLWTMNGGGVYHHIASDFMLSINYVISLNTEIRFSVNCEHKARGKALYDGCMQTAFGNKNTKLHQCIILPNFVQQGFSQQWYMELIHFCQPGICISELYLIAL